MTVLGVVQRDLLDLELAKFDAYGPEKRKKYSTILLAKNRQDLLSRLSTEERNDILYYEELVIGIENMVAARVKMADTAQPTPLLYNAQNHDKQFATSRNNSHTSESQPHKCTSVIPKKRF